MLDDLVEEPEGSAVNVVRANRVVALFQQQMRQRGGRCLSRCKRVTGDAALEHGHVFLESHTRWVLRAGVLEAFMLAERLLNISGCLINRNGHRAGCRIRLLSRVNSIGTKTHGTRLVIQSRLENLFY